MLWKAWLELLLDDKKMSTERTRDQLKQASSKSLQTISAELLDNIDKSSDAALATRKVSVKALDVSPSLRIAILGFPYWLTLLLTITAAGLSPSSRKEPAEPSSTILTLRPTNWLRFPYRAIQLISSFFPIATGILVASEASTFFTSSEKWFYWAGLVVATGFAAAVSTMFWREGRER